MDRSKWIKPSRIVSHLTNRIVVVSVTLTDLVVLIKDCEHTDETALLHAGTRTV